MPHQTISVTRRGHTLEVVLDRPDQLNAFDPTMRRELAELWESLRDDAELRCVVVTGRGRAFCAGADVNALAAGDYVPASAGYAGGLDFLPGEWLSVPVIVAVNGLCAGGGLHFVADADIVVSSDRAWFSDPHVSVGQVSGLEPLTLLGRISVAQATSLVLRGSTKRIDVQEALRIGLVDEVVPDVDLLADAHALADSIAAQSPAALQKSLALLRDARRAPIVPHLERAWSVLTAHQSHPDAAEGSRAFIAKRPAQWAPYSRPRAGGVIAAAE
jgi:enoyl-CoA hydratase/carnithine racemase